MAETLFEELKRYVRFGPGDEAALRAFAPIARPDFEQIAKLFYDRILTHEDARRSLVGGESRVGQLKITLVAWMNRLLTGPWDEEYYEARARIGRVHVRIALPQHYMFGAMNVVRAELLSRAAFESETCVALEKILDLELAIMLHTYREDLLAQHERAERLSTFGQLVGSIGHELRNPLGVMESSLYILKGRLGDDERANKHADRIGEQLSLANRIISDLLDMIRDRPLQREAVLLQPLLEEVRLAAGAPAGVKIELLGTESVPALSGDRGQLRQVFLNLIENAVHACGTAGTVSVRGGVDGRLARVTVEDTGPGIDESIRRRLFEPLVTTRAKGIGLGLALVKRIVERHAGTIAWSSPPGKGAQFSVHLPLAP